MNMESVKSCETLAVNAADIDKTKVVTWEINVSAKGDMQFEGATNDEIFNYVGQLRVIIRPMDREYEMYFCQMGTERRPFLVRGMCTITSIPELNNDLDGMIETKYPGVEDSLCGTEVQEMCTHFWSHHVCGGSSGPDPSHRSRAAITRGIDWLRRRHYWLRLKHPNSHPGPNKRRGTGLSANPPCKFLTWPQERPEVTRLKRLDVRDEEFDCSWQTFKNWAHLICPLASLVGAPILITPDHASDTPLAAIIDVVKNMSFDVDWPRVSPCMNITVTAQLFDARAREMASVITYDSQREAPLATPDSRESPMASEVWTGITLVRHEMRGAGKRTNWDLVLLADNEKSEKIAAGEPYDSTGRSQTVTWRPRVASIRREDDAGSDELGLSLSAEQEREQLRARVSPVVVPRTARTIDVESESIIRTIKPKQISEWVTGPGPGGPEIVTGPTMPHDLLVWAAPLATKWGDMRRWEIALPILYDAAGDRGDDTDTPSIIIRGRKTDRTTAASYSAVYGGSGDDRDVDVRRLAGRNVRRTGTLYVVPDNTNLRYEEIKIETRIRPDDEHEIINITGLDGPIRRDARVGDIRRFTMANSRSINLECLRKLISSAQFDVLLSGAL